MNKLPQNKENECWNKKSLCRLWFVNNEDVVQNSLSMFKRTIALSATYVETLYIKWVTSVMATFSLEQDLVDGIGEAYP